jgi:hypothetical protein
MLRTFLIYGLLAGAIIVGLGAIAFQLLELDNTSTGEIIGYATMLIGLSMTYLGVKRYRDDRAPDPLSFGTAFKVGLGIVLVASFVYVASWMLSYYFGSGAEMMEGYFTAEITNIQNSGLSAEVIAVKLEELQQMRANYSKPHNMALITFLEVFPVGLIVSLLTAWLLRSR